ncbi:ABC-F family ATP-binding cassette domain-containing protein [Spiroplasma turonicum]|uniref:ABC transporter ATP-binding protein n=1 Tax=Spiroplasma turonicum TaxID=216946 RepID=A0A0K1P7M7_9MOLU|nr:ABC-F family ATP-binding cassette domain-containing protein [Spiroplasma turonicum]AKU80316.1 ABC transporter ATP-binding protein [Spiroplasma turonicum]ALX71317.1 ABC transporter ATP-binding protein [Spiroplasma turonicum]
MGLVSITNLTHANGEKKLYKETSLKLNRKEHIALVGPNGAGKTTLLNIISKKIIPDMGKVEIHARTKVGYLDQHLNIEEDIFVGDYLKTAFKELYDIESRMNEIYEKMAENYDEDELVKALKYQDILNHNDFDSIDKKVGNLVNGLGIGIDKLENKMSELSGGQKNKVMLAKLLLSDNDFLVLDEPTNFLDIEQVNWLANFLQGYEKAFIMVSHDQDFINKTCNIIYALDNLKLTRYVGNYDKYLEELAIQQEQYDKDFLSQQRKIKKLETYIAKNSARLSTAKSAQSRKKTLDKIDVMDKRKENPKPNFNFLYKAAGSDVILKAEDLVIGYDSPLLHKLNFEIRKGEKCIIKGKNGIGKTTFLKTLSKEIEPFSGVVSLGNGVSFTYFKQIEKVGEINAINYLMNKYPQLTDREARAKIGQFGLRNDLMIRPMSTLSGGEQTKVRLSSLSMLPCSLLILDEPTNHIDSLAKESLLEAIIDFEGTVLLTTHDINFSTKWADKVINFEDLI